MRETKNLLYIDNKLAQASYSLNLSEQRLLFILLSKVKPTYYGACSKEEVEGMSLEEMSRRLLVNDRSSKELTIGDCLDELTLHTLSIHEYASFCHITNANAKTELLEAANNLFNRYITVKKEGKGFKKFRWIASVEFDEQKGLVNLRWSIDILPYIGNLRSYFTKLKLSKLIELKSVYSWKMYTLLASKQGENRYKGQQKVAVKELMFFLDVPESCKEFKHFNNLILKKVAMEFVGKLKMDKFKVEFVKEGRFVTEVVFKGFSVVSEEV